MSLAEGWRALEADDLPAAEAHARRALERDPADPEATHLLGASLLYQGRYAEALGPLEAVHRAAPRKGSGHRLGYCLLALGEPARAAALLVPEVAAYPDFANARLALGVALVRLSRREEALAQFAEAARLDPASAEATTNAGGVLAELGRHAEALPYLERAVALQPGLADAHFNLGIACQYLKRHGEAAAHLRRALGISPRLPYALGQRLWNERAMCRWAGLEDGLAELRQQVSAGVPASPFTFLALVDQPLEQRRCAERHVAQALPSRPAPLWRGERYRHERLRLAYLSADFHEHATAQLTAGLFERHDRARFETFAVSYGPDDGSPMRARLARAFEHFVDVRALSDAQVARLLHEREIDVAIDLKGHTADARPGILAHRPAPVQIAWLGYPGTMGAHFVDYVLADAVVLPEAEQAAWSEAVVHLPGCYQPNDAGRAVAPPAGPRPGTGFVFCCFNNSYKITPALFGIWMRLLGAVPGSVLWLLEDNAEARANLEREAAARGVGPTRLVFAPRLPYAAHLARHALADLFLDTLPVNAHTGAGDALWAGLPLLTCSGNAFAGRVAASLLHAVGLPELVTRSLAEYEALALALAREPARLRALRQRLVENRTRAPLFDTARFCRQLEATLLDLRPPR